MDQNSPRALVEHLDREFSRLISSLTELANSTPPDLLYRRPPSVTLGENLLRSAAVLEQAFGGLTVNLWDDPFEWTLPETLSTPEQVAEYLAEVDATRQRALHVIGSDKELTKYISGPSGEPQQLFTVLLAALLKASDYYGRAVATRKMLSGDSTQRGII
ncbi:MAG TPA: hypothetical protein VGW58_01560 [Pyrinomonadaceae bacterium]|nr:hypothetical protein [Pyrinomonadaceae bacterium]